MRDEVKIPRSDTLCEMELYSKVPQRQCQGRSKGHVVHSFVNLLKLLSVGLLCQSSQALECGATGSLLSSFDDC